jgi:hypothetical protein
MARQALRATGVSLRIADPVENRIEALLAKGRPAREPRTAIEDPTLAAWLFGRAWTEGQRSWVNQFSILRVDERPARAWLVPMAAVADPTKLSNSSGEPAEILSVFERAQPVSVESASPERLTVVFQSDEPSWLILSQLADPQWTGRWFDADGNEVGEARIVPTFHKTGESGGWQRVAVPAQGWWTLRMEYDAEDARNGLAVSAIAWSCWMIALFKHLWPQHRSRRLAMGSEETTEA